MNQPSQKWKVTYQYGGYVWPRIVTAENRDEAIEKAEVPSYGQNVTARKIEAK